MAAEPNPRLLHRIFIGVEIPVIILPPPPEGDFLLLENSEYLLKENNEYILLENN